jgi:hypothetical protein
MSWHDWQPFISSVLCFFLGFSIRPRIPVKFRKPYVSVAMLKAAKDWADKQNEFISLHAIQGVLRIAVENVREEE